MTEFLTADTSLPPYMVFPRFLLDTELNETTKLLYVILLDVQGSLLKMKVGQTHPVMCSSILPLKQWQKLCTRVR